MNRTLRTLSWAAGLGAVLTAGLGAPARAADIDDLQSAYTGAWHSTTNADFENVQGEFTVSGTSANGKFTGFLAGMPISGKVTSTGKVTFSGQSTGAMQVRPLGVPTGTAKITKGKAQLSATGRFLIGSFTYKGTGGLAVRSGKYLLGMAEDSNPELSRGNLGATASPGDLRSTYWGSIHSTTNPAADALLLEFSQLQQTNGKLTGQIGMALISGTVSPEGKLRFKGTLEVKDGSNTFKGKGQLSATGRFILGSLKANATGSLANESGKFIYGVGVVDGPSTNSGRAYGTPR